MDRVLKGKHLRLEILPPLPEYAEELAALIRHNRQHLDMWRGDVLKYETDELAFYKLLMDNYHYEKEDGYLYHIMKGQKIIGHISLLSAGKFWEMAYWLDKDHTGKGYMREALAILEKAWFEKSTEPLTILVKPHNGASLNVVHKMGYVSFGQNRYLKNFAMFMGHQRQITEPECIVSAQNSVKKQNIGHGYQRGEG